MKLCRGAVFPRIGHQFLRGDFGGIEVKMACCYVQDPRLIKDVNAGDMHKDMAVELFKLDGLDKEHKGESRLRQGAKNGFVFPEFYGDYWGNCVPSLLEWAKESTLKNGKTAWEHLQDKKLIILNKKGEIKNKSAFEKHVQQVEDDFWNVRYKVYSRWKKKWWAQYQKRGYIEMFTGFRCGGSVMRQNECINAPFQGSAFHCLLWSIIQLDKIQQERDWNSRIVNQIYDEVMWDAHPDELKKVARQTKQTATKDLPEHWPWIIVPLEIDIEAGGVDEAWNAKNENELGEF
jgi:DNA polymerase I-like protein with 3'-5' exonuclease and polymerase domains